MPKKTKDKINKKFLKSQNPKLHIVDLVLSVLSIALDVVVFNVLGNTLSEYNLWCIAIFVVIFVVIAFLIIWWFTSLFLTQIHYADGRKIASQCMYNNSMCCGSAVCESIAKNHNIELSDDNRTKLFNDFSLCLQSDIIEKESKFKENNGIKIWIVSDNLNSEVYDNIPPAYVVENVKNGIEYNFIYLQKNNLTIERNKNNILRSLDGGTVNFIHWSVSDADLGSYIVYLFGIVIYEFDNLKYEGYFSLRNYSNSQRIPPIYLKMPKCMVDKYMKIFREEKDKVCTN